MSRERGVVQAYFSAKGYGFIRASDGELFFHVRDVRSEDPGAVIRAGRAVEFEAIETGKGARAVDVVLL